MKELHQSPIKVKPSAIQGYGVFADTDFAADDLIEECHILVMHDYSILFNYIFSYRVDGKQKYCLPLGYGALYNHSNEPNAKYRYNEEMSMLTFIALKPIKTGEEILINYGSNWFAKRDTKPLQTTLKWRMKRMIAKYSFLFRAFLTCTAIYLTIMLLHAFTA